MIGTESTVSFRTRARAVDMLGRQQIAGIPTAISELFKNAHDAYADTVEADFFRYQRLFVVRDDGIGMTYDEFVNNWLTLATDIKGGGPHQVKPMWVPHDKEPRTILGEKGIGRLAIASIGPQVLVLTRSAQNASESEMVAAFINWGLFGLPGIDIDDIKVPVRTFPPGVLPTKHDLDGMIRLVRESLQNFESRTNPVMLVAIREQLDQFDLGERLWTHHNEQNPSGQLHGTHFYIQPTDDALELDIDGTGAGDAASPLLKMLIGFANTMTPGFEEPVIRTAFRDHKTPDLVEDMIDEQHFFTPEEFEAADHHLLGQFDEYGQFQGTVKVYGQDPIHHVLPWSGAQGKKTECGPFRLNVAVVQGEQRNSRLPRDEWALIVSKLNRIGGLYIYKDGIRILPYGDTDYDFLDIEKNRTKSAGYYYFSYRRIFGTIDIDQTRNANLVEKAGREGFRQNRAYRQFRDILMNFFVQIAADFFRQGGVHVELFEEERAELERLELIKRRREHLVSVRRKELQDGLEDFFSKLDQGMPQKRVAEIMQALQDGMRRIDEIPDPSHQSSEMLTAEVRARRAIKKAKDDLHLTRPRGVGLSKSTRQSWDAYRSELLKLDENCFDPAEAEIDDIVRSYAHRINISIDQRRRLEAAVTETVRDVRRRTRREFTDTRQEGKEVSERVVQLTRQVMVDVDSSIRKVLSDIARLDVADKEESELVELRAGFEDTLNQATGDALSVLASTKDQLKAIRLEGEADGSIVTHLDVLEATESELLDARERADLDLEMTQLGAAIEVINHEFDASIKSVRSSLRRLKSWADLNPGLRGLHDDIRTSFEHLDGYLTLFTPLQRRLYRQEVEIRGSAIIRFLTDLFRERLRRHEVHLASTSRFDRHTFTGYPSTFYPVFVNLVDNSLFWLSDQPQPRQVLLDVIDGSMMVSDSGPGIHQRDWESVFELGFTRKPTGRGLGLYIAREVLRRAGYSIDVQANGPLNGACFGIRPLREDKN